MVQVEVADTRNQRHSCSVSRPLEQAPGHDQLSPRKEDTALLPEEGLGFRV